MTNYFKVEGQCEFCGGMATENILSVDMLEYVNVCDEHFKKIFSSVANEGINHFYDWAEEMYGQAKAFSLCKEIYGENAIATLTGNKEGDDSELVAVFTYGTLKDPRNIERDGGVNIIENCTISGHKMFLYNNAYPVTTYTGDEKDIVYGTLFEIPKYMVLYHYDLIEGYEPKREAERNLYNRMQIEVITPSGEKKIAHVYYANQHMFAREFNKRNYIHTGMWEDRHLAQSYRKYDRKGGKK